MARLGNVRISTSDFVVRSAIPIPADTNESSQVPKLPQPLFYQPLFLLIELCSLIPQQLA